MASTKKFLDCPVVYLDIEGKVFHATIDGKTKKIYTFEEVLAGKHFIDNPGHDAAAETAHFSAKPESGTDHGAQPFTQAQLDAYHAIVKALGVTHWHLPGQQTKRVLSETGFGSPDACNAWCVFADKTPKIVGWARKLQPITGRDRCRREKLNASREDSGQRIDYLATEKYRHQETENARAILERAVAQQAITGALSDEFKIKRMKLGRRKGMLTFEETWVMPLYVAACTEDGQFRCDSNGNPIGVRQVLGGILQHHVHKSGKGSKASARAKTRLRLRTSEKRFRAANQIPDKDFPDPIPCVRKEHQRMNRELVKIFRKFAK